MRNLQPTSVDDPWCEQALVLSRTIKVRKVQGARWRALAGASFLLVAANVSAAQARVPSSSAPGAATQSPADNQGVLLVEQADAMIMLAVRQLDGGSIGLFLSSQSPHCRFPDILLEQAQYEPALAYSEKALAILSVTFKNKRKELEPFLNDNRRIREKLGRR